MSDRSSQEEDRYGTKEATVLDATFLLLGGALSSLDVTEI
jgi:hypothetical protein